MLSATPNNTANCSGTSRIATKVTIMLTCEIRPVFQAITACSMRNP